VRIVPHGEGCSSSLYILTHCMHVRIKLYEACVGALLAAAQRRARDAGFADRDLATGFGEAIILVVKQ